MLTLDGFFLCVGIFLCFWGIVQGTVNVLCAIITEKDTSLVVNYIAIFIGLYLILLSRGL